MSRRRVNSYVKYLVEEITDSPEEELLEDYEEDEEEEHWNDLVDNSTRIDHFVD